MKRVVPIAVGCLLACAGLVGLLFVRGPFSLKAAYTRDRSRAATNGPLITEADLLGLPPAVQRYLRITGFVGAPRPSVVNAKMNGRIRSGSSAPWMRFSAEQRNTFAPHARLFYLDALMYGLPVQGYHRFVAGEASMDIRLLGLLTVQQSSGTEFTRAETVTLFNDMCVLAPGSLLDPAIAWSSIDAHAARAVFTHAGHAIQAELRFNDAGELVDFQSDDRTRAMPDGSMQSARWSTPLHGYRHFGRYYLASAGEARWYEADGSFAYIEVTFNAIHYAP